MNFLIRLCCSLIIVFVGPVIAGAIPVLVLTDSNQLVRIETTTPQIIQSRTLVTGLQAGERLLAIDFRPATGQLRAKGVLSATNAVLHPWLQAELERILAALPPVTESEEARPLLAQWETWLGP